MANFGQFLAKMDKTGLFFKKLHILKLDDLFKTASFMWDFDHGTLPEAFNCYFTKVSEVHQYNTWASVNKLLHTVLVKSNPLELKTLTKKTAPHRNE